VSRSVPVVEFLNVVNGALERHRDAFPYKQILDLWDRILGEKEIGIAVYESDPSSPFDFHTARVKGGRLEYRKQGKGDPDFTWTVERGYLQKVVDDPEPYLEHPERLDLDWLKSRLGIEGG